MLVHRSRTEVCIHQQQTRRMIHIAVCYRRCYRTCMAPYLCTVFGSFIRLIYRWGCLEDVCVKHKHTLEELRKKHSPPDFDDFRARTPENEQLVPQLYCIRSVGRHSQHYSLHFQTVIIQQIFFSPPSTVNLPRLGVGRNDKVASGGRWSVKRDSKTQCWWLLSLPSDYKHSNTSPLRRVTPSA
jgi:hypothetical protein